MAHFRHNGYILCTRVCLTKRRWEGGVACTATTHGPKGWKRSPASSMTRVNHENRIPVIPLSRLSWHNVWPVCYEGGKKVTTYSTQPVRYNDEESFSIISRCSKTCDEFADHI